MMVEAKVNYKAALASKLNSGSNHREVFHYMKRLTNSSGLPPVMYCNTSCASTARHKADLFDLNFHSVFTVIDSDQSLTFLQPRKS